MAFHKNQHFVPRCYLRPFTHFQAGTSIHLFNINLRRGIRNAPVKTQCSGNYFYGEDLAIEKALQQLEGEYAAVLRRIAEPGYSLAEADKSQLRQFCLLQHCRTDAAAQRSALSMNAMLAAAHKDDAPETLRSTRRDSVLAGMSAFARAHNALDDLEVCLLRNNTKSAFITSDDPAVLTNRWYQQKPLARGQTGGIANSGVAFFLPLTPQICCMIYDSDVYSLRNVLGWVDVSKIDDIVCINEHQHLNCFANIYFSSWDALDEVAASFARAADYRPAVRHQITVAKLEREDEHGKIFVPITAEDLPKGTGALLHSRTIRPHVRKWPSFLKWCLRPKIYSNGTGTGYSRRWSILREGGVGYRLVK